MLRTVLAVVAGVLSAFIVVAVIESLGHAVYPSPADIASLTPAEMADFVDALPLGALLFVLAAWGIGALDGGLVAGLIDRARPMRAALLVGALVLAATVANLVMIPHPIWFSIVGVAAVVFGAWAGGKAALALHARRSRPAA